LCVWGVENAAQTDCNPQKGAALQKGCTFFGCLFSSALAHQTDVKFHGASYGLDADTLVVAVRGAALLSGQVGY